MKMSKDHHTNHAQTLKEATSTHDAAAILDALLALEEGDIEATREVLLGCLASPDDSIRSTTVYVVGKVAPIGDAEFCGKIVSLLADAYDQVRVEAAEALGLLEYGAGYPALSDALLTDPNELVRVCAAEALGKLFAHAPQEITEALLLALEDEDGLVRGYAADALVHANPSIVIVPIHNLLEKEDDAYYRAWLFQALIRLGERHYIPALLDTLRVEQAIFEDEESHWAILLGVMPNFLRDIVTHDNLDEIAAYLSAIAQTQPYLSGSMATLISHITEPAREIYEG